MRFSTNALNIEEYRSMISTEAENALCESDDLPQFVSFKFDFPELEDDEARKLEPSDGDLSIMISLFLIGSHTGEQEHWWFDENDEEHSTRLTWVLE